MMIKFALVVIYAVLHALLMTWIEKTFRIEIYASVGGRIVYGVAYLLGGAGLLVLVCM